MSTSTDVVTLWIDPSFGVSGDMLLGMLAGLLDDPTTTLKTLDHLGLAGSSVSFESTIRNSLSATRALVTTSEHHHHRPWSEIDALLKVSALPDPVADGARRTFRMLGDVEAGQHRVPLEQIEFHEIGALDAILDIVGVHLLVEGLREQVFPATLSIVVGPIGLGHGVVASAHGLLPLPAPATVALLRGCPTRALDVSMETCTPTGAALLVSLANKWGPLPTGVLGTSSRGAGQKNPTGHPNVVTGILVADHAPTAPAPWKLETSTLLETNLDDVTSELLAFTVERLLAQGADDAWVVPITMKKGRAAHELRVLCSSTRADQLTDLIMRETGTLGVRSQQITKQVAERSFVTITVDGHEVKVKRGPHGAKAEHEDLARIAVATGRSIRDVSKDVMRAMPPGNA